MSCRAWARAAACATVAPVNRLSDRSYYGPVLFSTLTLFVGRLVVPWPAPLPPSPCSRKQYTVLYFSLTHPFRISLNTVQCTKLMFTASCGLTRAQKSPSVDAMRTDERGGTTGLPARATHEERPALRPQLIVIVPRNRILGIPGTGGNSLFY